MSSEDGFRWKTGKFSKQETDYMREHARTKTPDEISIRLGRSPALVRKWVEEHVALQPGPDATREERKQATRSAIRVELRNSLDWKKLADEFTEDELAYYEEEYVELVAQFRDDVWKTERQQIRKAITLDILMRRNMAMRKQALEDIARLEKMQARATRDFEAARDKLSEDVRQEREAFLLNIETQLQASKAAEQSKTKEYTDLDLRHQKLMQDLKATREQRISKVESDKRSLLGILKELQDEEVRLREEELMNLMKRAAEREHGRLSRPHKYDDGNEDQPILSAETVDALDRGGVEDEDDPEGADGDQGPGDTPGPG